MGEPGGHYFAVEPTAPSAPRAVALHLPDVSLSLQATARVYVCLLGDGGRKLIAGTELQPGASTPIFHARRFKITLGNKAEDITKTIAVQISADKPTKVIQDLMK